jgi:hypothetical protein
MGALRHLLELLGWSQLSPDERFLTGCGAAGGLGVALLLWAVFCGRRR